jgi:hypothetical protein
MAVLFNISDALQVENIMTKELDELRRVLPDLVRLDPLSAEVQDWLDRAYDAVKRIDEVEGVIFRMHQRYLLDPAEKTVASAEIAETLDRAARTAAIMCRMGVKPRSVA